ncbi:16S rRNA (uracil(1498)-N(3))-methyltransferase [Parapedobacter sp. 10938]|uniref:16S rRNA (uracil(1498)-N(3))-methyltransferase n=1 Tax=Parapedobacter flavus TaxID=3110225 RepID=UPI002DB9A3ED|nr:16S rRNA (uracil(1498)-N(3))-methyltransferase [Parapedobacter sp. 10938]MEC3879793.1 16S rRNA (uracil(1498)-N(3))-methyltransferase [Parapedobacter sp. 10938]
MHLFYTPDIQPQHKAFILNEEESKHAVRVLRLSAGQRVQLIDGRGGRYTAMVTDAHPKRAVLEILSVSTGEGKHPYHLHIAMAPTKNMDRMEWFLEKATEVGVDEVTPIICDHSERTAVKPERLHKVAVAAMKQSQRAYLPQVNPAIRFADFVKQELAGKRFIAHCADGEKKYFSQLLQPSEPTVVLIGPEGDFSAAEIDAAIRNGYMPTTFGTMRLRTETAGLVACVEAHLRHVAYLEN